MANYVKIHLVTTPEYHLWMDVLHARKLANETQDDWNQGFYTRITIIFAWITLEQSCKDALNVKSISGNFRKNLSKLVVKKKLKPIDWDSDVWSKASDLKDLKNDYTHNNYDQSKLWPNLNKADEAIVVARNAIKDIYLRAGKPEPAWVNYDGED